MTKSQHPRRSRAAEAFRSLDAGSDLARRRVWRRVEQQMSDDHRRSRRRLGWAAGIAASAVAALAIVLPSVSSAVRAWYQPSSQEQQRVAVSAVFEMLGQQQAGNTSDASASVTSSDGVEQFVQYLVTSTEEKTGAQ